MRVLIAGAGAIGQWLGARLQAAGHTPELLTTPRHVHRLRGLRIEGLTTFAGPLTAHFDPGTLRAPYGAIVLTSKAHLTQHIAPRVAPLLGPGAPFVSLQNGLGNVQKIARSAPPAQVVSAITSHGVTLDEPGRLRHTGAGATQVGPGPDGAEAPARLAHRILADAGMSPEWQPQMRGYVWRKAIINHAVNPVAALHGVRNGELAKSPALHALSATLLKEALALAERGRVPLPPGDAQELLDGTLRRTADNKVSMLQDVEAKRPTEIETLTGRLVRLGEKLLVSLPRSEAVYGRLKDLETSYLGAEAVRAGVWDELPWEQEPF